MRRGVLSGVLLVLLLLTAQSVSAHATLIRSDPPANAVLSEAPSAIKLWFSEPVEAQFSSIDLVDPAGQRLGDLHSQVDAADPKLLSVGPGSMANGVYTVVWRVTSAADGHPTSGSFPLTIGAAGTGSQAAQVVSAETLPPAAEVIVRWLNLLLSASVIGGAGFWLFIWKAAAPPDLDANAVLRRVRRLLWAAWALLGLVIALSLVQQTARAAGLEFGAALTSPALAQVVTSSRYGATWMLRAITWLALGLSIYLSMRRDAGWWLILISGAALLLATALNSHSVGAPVPLTAVAADWLHLLAMALWVGGLIHFLAALGRLRSFESRQQAGLRAGLVLAFSNLGRVAVAALLLTGLYVAYLEVGLGEGLATTVYGQVLLVKVILVAPLLVLAAINLVITQRRLYRAAGTDAPDKAALRWGRLLRGLVGAEVVLTVMVLFVVGVLTATTPARGALAAQVGAANANQTVSYTDMQMTDQNHVILSVTPGYAGVVDNYTIGLYSMMTGEAINDATLVRLQFTTTSVPGLGKSELRLKPVGKGQYSATGSNLSLPGLWRVRAIIQRENAYDEFVDFPVNAVSAPPLPDDPMSFPEHRAVLLGLGILTAVAGGVFFGVHYRRVGIGLLSLLLLALGLVFVASIFLIR